MESIYADTRCETASTRQKHSNTGKFPLEKETDDDDYNEDDYDDKEKDGDGNEKFVQEGGGRKVRVNSWL